MLSGAGRIYAGAEEKVGIMNKGKLMLHRSKIPI